jgi:hypothetical protein
MDGCPNTCVVDTKLNIHVMQENLRQNYIEFLANNANNKTQSMFWTRESDLFSRDSKDPMLRAID